jgi:transcription elongation factor Elf1
MINSFVLCKKCGNPETTNTISGKKKNMTINLICRSCGHTVELNNTDKFVKYIILHASKVDTTNERSEKETEDDGVNGNSGRIGKSEVGGIEESEVGGIEESEVGGIEESEVGGIGKSEVGDCGGEDESDTDSIDLDNI